MGPCTDGRALPFQVNDRRFEVSGQTCFQPLAEFLRQNARLTGTKIVCAEGDCGACTVLLGNPRRASHHQLQYQAVNSCILPLFLVDGCQIITVEGLREGDQLHPAQSAMVEHFGAQCGYCTPGFICALAALTESCHSRQDKQITADSARDALTGNLCRCTGYEPILSAAQAIPLQQVKPLTERYRGKAFLQNFQASPQTSVSIEADSLTLHIPATLAEALELKAKIPNLRVIAGATDEGVLINKGRREWAHVLSLQNIAELRTLEFNQQALWVGTSTTLSELEPYAQKHFPEFYSILQLFASPQIRNQATLLGNALNASPIADSIPFLMISGAEIELQSTRGQRWVPLESFYQGYKQMDLKGDELATRIKIPAPRATTTTRLYKVSRRKDLDISAVTLGIHVELEKTQKPPTIREARVAMGGVGPTVLRLKTLESQWKGATLDSTLIEKTRSHLPQWITPLSDVRGSKDFRHLLAQNLFRKFYQELQNEGLA